MGFTNQLLVHLFSKRLPRVLEAHMAVAVRCAPTPWGGGSGVLVSVTQVEGPVC